MNCVATFMFVSLFSVSSATLAYGIWWYIEIQKEVGCDTATPLATQWAALLIILGSCFMSVTIFLAGIACGSYWVQNNQNNQVHPNNPPPSSTEAATTSNV